MDPRKPALAIALVSSIILSEAHIIFPPPSTQTPVQFVGGSYLPMEPDHAHHDSEVGDVDETTVLVATASVHALVIPSEMPK